RPAGRFGAAMTVDELLEDLARQGFTLAAEGDGIRVRPVSRLPEELRQALRRRKPEVLAILAARPAPLSPAPPSEPSAADWDVAAAARLLAELQAEVERIEAREFGGRLPEPLQSVLTDALALGEQYVRDHAAEAARGWDALELLRGLVPHVRRCAANAR